MMRKVLDRIVTHTAKIGIIGVGYVGLPMAIEMSKENVVIAYDTDEKKIQMLKSGKSYVGDIDDSEVLSAVSNGRIMPSMSESALDDVDCYIVCVPTPLNLNKQPELKYIISAASVIAKHLHEESLVVFESTTYPGTTLELIKPLLEKSGLICDKDFYLAFSPERVDPGNSLYKTFNTAKVVGGTSKEATEIASKLYEVNLECEVFPVSSPTVAEMSKILENTYRNINIGLINEFAIICNKMGVDIWEVIDAAKTKPFGFQAFYPGPGVGGHCIPLDPLYLSWKVKEYGLSATMIETSERIIDHMPDYVVERIIDILNNGGRPLNGSRILVAGVAYKANISDCRESPSLHIIQQMILRKACVEVYDPFVDTYKLEGREYETVSIDELEKKQYDLVVILVDHKSNEYDKMLKSGVLIFDTKNALNGISSDRIIKL